MADPWGKVVKRKPGSAVSGALPTMTAAPAPAAAVETNSAKATAEPPAKAVPVAPKVEEEKKPEKPLPPPPAAKPVSIAAQSEPKKAEQSAKKEEEEDDLPKRAAFDRARVSSVKDKANIFGGSTNASAKPIKGGIVGLLNRGPTVTHSTTMAAATSPASVTTTSPAPSPAAQHATEEGAVSSEKQDWLEARSRRLSGSSSANNSRRESLTQGEEPETKELEKQAEAFVEELEKRGMQRSDAAPETSKVEPKEEEEGQDDPEPVQTQETAESPEKVTPTTEPAAEAEAAARQQKDKPAVELKAAKESEEGESKPRFERSRYGSVKEKANVFGDMTTSAAKAGPKGGVMGMLHKGPNVVSPGQAVTSPAVTTSPPAVLHPTPSTPASTEKNAVATPSPSEVKPQGSISQMAKSFESPPVSQPEKVESRRKSSVSEAAKFFEKEAAAVAKSATGPASKAAPSKPSPTPVAAASSSSPADPALASVKDKAGTFGEMTASAAQKKKSGVLSMLGK